jgi:hypothetical protein
VVSYAWSFEHVVDPSNFENRPGSVWGIAAALLAALGVAFAVRSWPKVPGIRRLTACGVIGAAALLLATTLVPLGDTQIPAVLSAHAAALVISRFLEYETSLLAKSAVFTLSGIAVLWAGARYERRLRRGEAAHGE